MNLDPETYECPIHHVDLTALVVAQLGEDEDSDVAFDGRPVARRLRRHDRVEPRQFEVVVTCSGEGATHRHVCQGTYVP